MLTSCFFKASVGIDCKVFYDKHCYVMGLFQFVLKNDKCINSSAAAVHECKIEGQRWIQGLPHIL